ncbi:hypothetical protein [Catellatospora coxensis]|uniref:Uncharacterized protein n=1 Tax=Catellatospora coxensis TaxID=310354 RepID=A0A8J3P6Q2_9ACTN|nr:hypothetical protein [Catellatospora coxensis]GIG06076.1 hypothetical protein Cco03nite_27760 [Catellatospora coxensis]
MLLTIKRGLPLLGVLTGGMLVSSVAGTALLDQDLMLLGFFAGVVAAVGGIYVIKGRDLRMRWGFAACGLALLINIAFMQAASSVVLEFAGEPVAATVVAAREGYEGKGARSHRYTLTELGGAPISGELTLKEGEPLRIGDQPTVLRDPAGLANPMLADEPVAGSAGALLIFWLVVAVPALLAGRPYGQPARSADRDDAVVSPVVEVRRGRDRPQRSRRG